VYSIVPILLAKFQYTVAVHKVVIVYSFYDLAPALMALPLDLYYVGLPRH
jgi:hypothetical protein